MNSHTKLQERSNEYSKFYQILKTLRCSKYMFGKAKKSNSFGEELAILVKKNADV